MLHAFMVPLPLFFAFDSAIISRASLTSFASGPSRILGGALAFAGFKDCT